jgi:hypothetical protein
MSLLTTHRSVFALAIAGIASLTAEATSAAELVFGPTGHAMATSGISNTTRSNFYQLSKGRISGTMTKVTGGGMACNC